MSNEELAKRIDELERELAELRAKVEPEPKKEFKPSVWPRFDPTEGMGMPGSAMKAMTDLIPDLKGGKFDAGAWARTKVAEPGGFLGPEKTKAAPKEKASGGWVKPLEHSSPSSLRYIDQAMDMQDALDKRELHNRLRRL